MNDHISIKGAREHNLKNINLEIPKNKFIVFTGVSGSGKSSLAFDTIYAEGQRRYVESLSSYARQFLGIMNKPEVDLIEGLSPSISIDQKTVSHNPRSTVGTITEIYDYYRLLFARIGEPFCVNCNIKISKLTPDEITTRIINEVVITLKKEKLTSHAFLIISPVVREKKGEFTSLLENIQSKGYSKVIIDTTTYNVSDDIVLIKTNKHTISAIVDSFSLNYKNSKNKEYMSTLRSRIFSSVEQAVLLSDGLIILKTETQDILYSEKFTCPHCGLSIAEIEPRMFSFNSPVGACVECKGLGFITKIKPELVLNQNLSINEGAILPFAKIFFHITWFSRLLQTFLDDIEFDPTKPLKEVDKTKLKLLLWGNNKTYKVRGFNRFGKETYIWEKFIGIIPELERKYTETDNEHAVAEFEKYMDDEPCDACHGMRLKPEVLSIKIKNLNIYEMSEFDINTSYTKIESIEHEMSEYEKTVSVSITKEIKNRLLFLKNVGLSYLTINRSARTLSGGESQRIRLASQIGSGLTGVIYVLDEPSIGLHPRDVSALVASLKHLRDLGNTIIIVEHDLETILNADYIVDFGPLAGRKGGEILYSGPFSGLKNVKNSQTAKYLSGIHFVSSEVEALKKNKKNTEMLTISGCKQFNLKNITAQFPIGKLTCVTGVSGSGKSTLVVSTLYPALLQLINGEHKGSIGEYDTLIGYQYLDRVYLVDQSAIGRTPRSNPATYVGMFDHIRDLFAQSSDAKAKGYKKGRFSFNVKGGRCEKCSGAGTIKIEMQFLPDVYVKCDVCLGKRYNTETLEVKYKGKNIYDILNLTVDEAVEFFKHHPVIYQKLYTLAEIGLGYVQLGQPAPTLSGGEAQRIKLAHELSKKDTGRTIYILDEPTTGLHPYDIQKLIHALYKLVGKGNTIILIEHNLDVIRHSQYVVDLGPEGGDEGGKLLYQGETEGIVKIKQSSTGAYLKGMQTLPQ